MLSGCMHVRTDHDLRTKAIHPQVKAQGDALAGVLYNSTLTETTRPATATACPPSGMQPVGAREGGDTGVDLGRNARTRQPTPAKVLNQEKPSATLLCV